MESELCGVCRHPLSEHVKRPSCECRVGNLICRHREAGDVVLVDAKRLAALERIVAAARDYSSAFHNQSPDYHITKVMDTRLAMFDALEGVGQSAPLREANLYLAVQCRVRHCNFHYHISDHDDPELPIGESIDVIRRCPRCHAQNRFRLTAVQTIHVSAIDSAQPAPVEEP